MSRLDPRSCRLCTPLLVLLTVLWLLSWSWQTQHTQEMTRQSRIEMHLLHKSCDIGAALIDIPLQLSLSILPTTPLSSTPVATVACTDDSGSNAVSDVLDVNWQLTTQRLLTIYYRRPCRAQDPRCSIGRTAAQKQANHWLWVLQQATGDDAWKGRQVRYTAEDDVFQLKCVSPVHAANILIDQYTGQLILVDYRYTGK